ncbi:hypothetical protein [Pseudotabrizicola formosa]|uniref:hypothetical protein n=1 Tax=Pseudotabrizicola formosa TaxID=2030009 RepID=UPI000CD17E56|nr:hypothetical protein [Pseudotabrizicola formosa]
MNNTIQDDTVHPDPGPTLSPEAIEGRLLAQRKVLALILSRLLHQEGARDLRDALDTLSVMQDHQEDPGSILDGPEVIQSAMAVEIRAITLAATRAHAPAESL